MIGNPGIATPVSIANGGTASTTAAAARLAFLLDYYYGESAGQTSVSNTFADATGMSFTLPAGTFKLDMLMNFSCGSATPGFKHQLLFDQTVVWSVYAQSARGNPVTPGQLTLINNGTTLSLDTSTGVTQSYIHSFGNLTTSVSTLVKVQFAQSTTDAGNAITLIAKSFIECRRLA